MRLRRSFRPILRGLLAQRTRTLLALASVSIGVAAVILVGALAAGARREVLLRLDAMGTNLVAVRPAQVVRSVSRRTVKGSVSTLRMDDYEAIARLPLVAAAAPGAERPVRARANGLTTPTKVLGTSPDFPRVRNFRLAAGRFFDAEDDRDGRRVAVLGARVAAALFGEGEAVGREIRIRGIPFDVVGVLEPKGVLFDGSDEDNQILVPIRTALRRVLNVTWLTGVFVNAADREQVGATRAAVAALLRARHGREDFSLQNTEKLLAMQKRTADLLARIAGGVAAVALLVGGIGVLALMMMSVRERTSEIGLRRALGATARDILLQFLLEATLLAAGGWLVGLALGGAGAAAIALGTAWRLGAPVDALAASAAMVAVAGLGFGAVPALRAARLPPIGALTSR